MFIFAPLPRLTLITVAVIPRPFALYLRQSMAVGRAFFQQQDVSKD
ncbi:hypothetical protein [Corallococcus sp. CA047B]|nr:hypothetical protein [Corallococcus sp. CA047B]